MHNTNQQGNTMGQILHGCAATTAALRRAIQNSQESLSRMASRYHIDVKTVAKWRKRTSVKDSPMGPRHRHSTVLTAEQEAMIVAFRRQTFLPSGRLFIRSAIEHSELNPFKFASLFATTRHQPFTRCQRQASQEKVQAISDWLFSHRHRRSLHRRRTALFVRCHPPHLKIRLRRIASESNPRHGL